MNDQQIGHLALSLIMGALQWWFWSHIASRAKRLREEQEAGDRKSGVAAMEKRSMRVALGGKAASETENILRDIRRRRSQSNTLSMSIAALCFGGFLVSWLHERYPLSMAGIRFSQFAWLAFALSTLCTTVPPPPRAILVLRRFRSPSKELASLCVALGRACSGIGVPLTLQDESVRGAPPVLYEVISQGVRGPVGLALGATAAIIPLLAQRYMIALAIFVIAFAVLLLGERLARRAVVATNAKRGDVKRYIESLVEKIQTGYGPRRSITALRCSDQNWRPAIETAVARCDVIIIDLTHLSEALIWELELVMRTVSPRRVLLVWAEDRKEQILRTLRRHVEDVFSNQQTDDYEKLPPTVREQLRPIIPQKFLKQCGTFVYRNLNREMRGIEHAVMDAPLALAVTVRAAWAERQRAHTASAA